jgi:hypothetical protein
MIRYRNFLSLVVVLAGAAILAAPAPARAAFQMTLTEVNVNRGTTIASTTVVDNGSGDQSSMSGVIGFLGSLGDFNIQLSIGISNSQYGVQPPQLTINNVSIDSNGIALGQTRQVIITLQDTAFTVPDPGHAVMTSQRSTTPPVAIRPPHCLWLSGFVPVHPEQFRASTSRTAEGYNSHKSDPSQGSPMSQSASDPRSGLSAAQPGLPGLIALFGMYWHLSACAQSCVRDVLALTR